MKRNHLDKVGKIGVLINLISGLLALYICIYFFNIMWNAKNMDQIDFQFLGDVIIQAEGPKKFLMHFAEFIFIFYLLISFTTLYYNIRVLKDNKYKRGAIATSVICHLSTSIMTIAGSFLLYYSKHYSTKQLKIKVVKPTKETVSTTPAPIVPTLELLQKFQRLRDLGEITEKEFNLIKKKILESEPL